MQNTNKVLEYLEAGLNIPETHSRLIPNFIRYLKGFGEVGVRQCNDSEKAGVFLKRETNGTRLIGFLEVQQNPCQIEYFGYVPINIPASEFYQVPIYYLSSPPDLGINLVNVRLFAEIRDGKVDRIDGYGKRGIEFP